MARQETRLGESKGLGRRQNFGITASVIVGVAGVARHTACRNAAVAIWVWVEKHCSNVCVR